MDIVLRRRAVFTGLRPFFGDEELLSAVALWERKYAVQPAFALSGFIAQCCVRPELKSQRGPMLRAVVGALDLPAAQLLPDPGSQLQGAATLVQRTTHPGADDKTSMFVILLSTMLTLVDPSLQGIVRTRLLSQLGELKIEGLRRQALHDWLAGHVSAVAYSYSLDLLQIFINQAYVEMCEALGPVKTDQLLAQAIRRAEVQGESLSFRVHDLL
ncbi:hypothetical protein LG201_05245 [Methylobacillus gramineus]|uniref:hypothetical protein n=1 Tax=Methylobacillus gramineus TaxID=755169 RepID=UPI001D00065E|nr:hypothetical protein [Methylobacillus gramineus]MCB5184605.1 hypothetical protein [Methylobacillus gramineus]